MQRNTAGAPAPDTGHVGSNPGIVQEHEAIGIDLMLMSLPAPAEAGDLGPILFGCDQGLFLGGSPCRRTTRYTVSASRTSLAG